MDSQDNFNSAASSAALAPEALQDVIRTAADHIPGLVWTSLPDGHIDFLNQRWLAYTGMPLAQACGWGWRAAIHPEDLQGLLTTWGRVLASGASGDAEARLRRADGEFRWCAFSAVPLRDAHGGLVKWYGQTSDIDDIKRAEALLAGEKRLLEMVAKGEPLDGVLLAICSLVQELAPETRAAAMLLDAASGRLWIRAAPSLPAAFVQAIDGSRTRARGGPCALAADTGQTILSADIAADERWRAYAQIAVRSGLRACLSMPVLSSAGEVLGTLAMYFGMPRQPSEAQRQMLEQLTHLAAVAIERTRVDSALQASEARFRRMADATPDVMWITELEPERVVYASPSFERIWGCRVEDLYRQPQLWIEGIHPDDRGRIAGAFADWIGRRDQAHWEAEFRVVHTDGTLRWVHERGVRYASDDGHARVSGISTDITQRRQAEQALRESEAALLQAQRLEATGTLAGGIAHDFNNILAAILGYGEMALRDVPEGTRLRRDLDSILIAAERGRSLVDRVLAFSRSGIGERRPVHVEGVVREALNLLSATLPGNVRIDACLGAGQAAMLGDATQIHQVVMNLATNAVQAMAAGGVLTVELQGIDVNTELQLTTGRIAPGAYLRLNLADQGCGIAPAIVGRIFDPFFTTKDTGGGTGLGLSLVHGIVSEVGGAVDVSSRLGAGSVFTVYLPRAGDAADAYGGEPTELPRGRQQRILVIDDEAALVSLMTDTLSDLGYAPVGHVSSAEAWQAFHAQPQAFDAIVTDERMPGLTGSALVREVRALRADIPILLLGGFLGGAIHEQACAAGANEVLQKPLAARDLAAALARLLPAPGSIA